MRNTQNTDLQIAAISSLLNLAVAESIRNEMTDSNSIELLTELLSSPIESVQIKCSQALANISENRKKFHLPFLEISFINKVNYIEESYPHFLGSGIRKILRNIVTSKTPQLILASFCILTNILRDGKKFI